MNLMIDRFSSRRLARIMRGLDAPTRWMSAPMAMPTRSAKRSVISVPSPDDAGGEHPAGEDRGAEDHDAHGELRDPGDDVSTGAPSGEVRAEEDEEAAE